MQNSTPMRCKNSLLRSEIEQDLQQTVTQLIMQLECEAIIFDLDGVLVDSSACVEKHWSLWAAKHQLEAGKILAIAHGRRSVETIRLIALSLNAEQEASLIEADAAFDTEGICPIEGAANLLRSLPRHRWAIATSGTPAIATTRLTHTGLPIPDVFVTASDVTQGKPHPEVYLLAAQRLGIAPQNCVVVEDAPAGIQAARNAGMRAIAVTTTHDAAALAEADIITAHLSNMQVSDQQFSVWKFNWCWVEFLALTPQA
jgi:sugar-phosphatase